MEEKKATTRCILASMWNQREQPMYCSRCVCVFLFSLFNWFASLFLCYRILFSFAMCNVHWNDTGKIKFERKTFGWYDGLDQCAHAKRILMNCRNRKKSLALVSYNVMQIPINIYAYFGMQWIYSVGGSENGGDSERSLRWGYIFM